jgi:hypothetical protein
MPQQDVLDDADDFASRVIDLYTRILKKIPEEPGTRIPDDVAAVAFPLATLGEALDLLCEHIAVYPSPGANKRTAFVQTLHLFDALTSGAEHPFWCYAKSIQSATPHRRPPSKVEEARRAIAVGLLRALMAALGARSESRAGAMIEAACLKRGMRITRRQLTEWNTDFQTTRANDQEPDKIAQRLRTFGGKLSTDTDRILAAGIRNLDEFFGRLKRSEFPESPPHTGN